jgi:hypothetical protein
MNVIAANVIAPGRVTITYKPSGPEDVDARIAYDWAPPGLMGAQETAIQARCIELEDQIRAVCLAQSGSSRIERAALRAWAKFWSWFGVPEEDEDGRARVARTLQGFL